MGNNLPDQALGIQLPQGLSGDGTANLKPFTDDGRSDELVSGDFLLQLVVGGLVEGDQIVQLIAGLSLGPLLLLGLVATSRQWYFRVLTVFFVV